MTLPADLDISRSVALRPVPDVAADLGIGPHLLEPYGPAVAKIRLQAIDELADRPKAKYVVVSTCSLAPRTCASRSRTSGCTA